MVQGRVGQRILCEGHWVDALLLGPRGVVDCLGNLFHGQGKYVVEILKRF